MHMSENPAFNICHELDAWNAQLVQPKIVGYE
jgi:hypothetical protein